jgi:hypothetical protein
LQEEIAKLKALLRQKQAEEDSFTQEVNALDSKINAAESKHSKETARIESEVSLFFHVKNRKTYITLSLQRKLLSDKRNLLLKDKSNVASLKGQLHMEKEKLNHLELRHQNVLELVVINIFKQYIHSAFFFDELRY